MAATKENQKDKTEAERLAHAREIDVDRRARIVLRNIGIAFDVRIGEQEPTAECLGAAAYWFGLTEEQRLACARDFVQRYCTRPLSRDEAAPGEFFDQGHGITQDSLKFWRGHREQIGKVLYVEGSFDPPLQVRIDRETGNLLDYCLRIVGETGSIWLSGRTCGYGGEGPQGTFTVLRELGVPEDEARELMLSGSFVREFSRQGE